MSGEHYYQLLEISNTATEQQIRSAYQALARKYHPDARHQRHGSGVPDPERWVQIQDAWKTLCNPSKRLEYDLATFNVSVLAPDQQTGDAEATLRTMQMRDAERDIENMQVQVDRILNAERRSKGLIINEAIYGNLHMKADESDYVGPVVDVTMPVQALVEQHRIMLAAGSSKTKNPGFYNPLPVSTDMKPCLYVRYFFKGNLHEVTVQDDEALWIPLKAHYTVTQKGPSPPKQVMITKAPEGTEEIWQQMLVSHVKAVDASGSPWRNYAIAASALASLALVRVMYHTKE